MTFELKEFGNTLTIKETPEKGINLYNHIAIYSQFGVPFIFDMVLDMNAFDNECSVNIKSNHSAKYTKEYLLTFYN